MSALSSAVGKRAHVRVSRALYHNCEFAAESAVSPMDALILLSYRYGFVLRKADDQENVGT
jgi:hypothetical protein